jgi:hypothetical protein
MDLSEREKGKRRRHTRGLLGWREEIMGSPVWADGSDGEREGKICEMEWRSIEYVCLIYIYLSVPDWM